jgi:hypothetical protein
MNLKTKLAEFEAISAANKHTFGFKPHYDELLQLAQQQQALIEVLVSLVKPHQASDGNKIYYSDKIDVALDIAKDAGYL